jgi:predicted phosphoribosyltransferase
MKKEDDRVEATIMIPSRFSFESLGQYYQSFEQVEDEQVMQPIRLKTELRLYS